MIPQRAHRGPFHVYIGNHGAVICSYEHYLAQAEALDTLLGPSERPTLVMMRL